ncbi:MAG: SpoIIE family protein phosphatase [Actinomycetota bacterium]|nr:SpoIIE family protein phosphatase [Actinomycetota bacterium]
MAEPAENNPAADAFQAALLEDSAEDLYENAPCGYLSCTLDGTVVKVNQTFLKWTGYRHDELVGRRRFQELLTVGGQIYYETHYGPMLQMEGEARQIAVDIVRADGRRLPALVNSVVGRDQTGRPGCIRTAVFDATDRRAYERELLDARRRAEASEARARVLAQTLQQSLLPPAPPQIPGLDVAAVYRSAGQGDEVGGDFYDVFESKEGEWVVAIGDVRGKGAGAAVVTALARYTLRATAIRVAEPARVLETLNDVLLREEGDYYCTVAYATVRCEPGEACRITLACAGHPLPLLLAATRPPEPVGQPGTLLGLLASIDVSDVALTLEPGQAVVFFTDGVTEARCGREFFEEDRMVAVLESLRHEKARTIAEGLVDVVVDFQRGHPRDDIAVLVVKMPAPRQQAGAESAAGDDVEDERER